MKFIKTVKHFASGSDKFFDIFECTVDEVQVEQDSKGRKMLAVSIGDKEYKGLWNKSVEEHLTTNEGSPSFVVLWKSPKGTYMLAYSWAIWNNYITGDVCGDTTEGARETAETGDAFVYMWIDMANDRKYIGYHKGTLDDGYIASNDQLRQEYLADTSRFYRTILAWGTAPEMHTLETLLLLQLGAASAGSFFNISNNLRT